MRRAGRRPMSRSARAGLRLLALLLLAAAWLPAAAALAGEGNWVEQLKEKLPFDLTGEIEAGGQFVNHRGNSYVFDEYRDLDTMGTVPNFYLLGEDRQRRAYLEMGGTNLTRTDAYYFANTGRYNYYKFFFEFDRIPHVLANNAQTIYNEGPEANFTLRPGVTVPNLAATLNGASAATRGTVITAVNERLQPVKLGFQTDAARMGASWLVTPALELGVGYSLTMRDGRVPLGTVIGSPGGNVLELAIPRDERYHEVKASVEYVRDSWQVRGNYTFSAFENFIDAVTWQNPCGPGTNTCGIGATNSNNGLGRYSTMPDNWSHTFALAGGYSLPWWSTRINAAGSYGFWRQDDTFLPYTTATSANSTVAGSTSPDAKMNVALGNVSLSTRPLRDVTFRARYRIYDLTDDTPEHVFAPVLNPGDLTPATTAEERLRRDFRKQNTSADLSWRVIRPLTVSAGYEWERWDRKDREVNDSNEHILKADVDVKPLPWLSSRFRYSHGIRTIGANGYEPLGGNEESLPQLRKFDEADRTRDKGDVLIQVSPLDTLTLSGSFYIQNDGYWNTTFGLYQAQALGFAGDISWAPLERLSLFAGYARDIYRSQQQNCYISRTPVGGVIPAFPGDIPGSACHPLNIFTVNPKDTLDTVNVGATFALIPNKLDISAGYRFSFGRSEYALGAVPGDGPDVTTAGATNPGTVPKVENKFHIINVVARYSLTQNWSVKLGYQYERYEEKDFTTDAVQPSVAAVPGATSAADLRTILLGSKHPNYEAHIVAFSVGFRF